MTFTTRSMRRIAWALVFCCGLSLAQSPDSARESLRLDRMVADAKLWAAVKYFHPYLAYRDDIDWDAALVKAIPKVSAGNTPQDYSAAVAGMLPELGDPASRILESTALKSANPSVASDKHPFSRMTADNILVVDMTNYFAFQDYIGTREKISALKKEIPKAKAIVFDLRPSAPPTEDEQGSIATSLGMSGIAGMLTSSSLPVPGERRRMHVGYAPQDGTTSGDYSSGFHAQGRQAIQPATDARDVPVVFLLGPQADLPEMALSFQAAGKGAILVEGEADDSLAVTTEVIHLTDDVRAQIRLGELVYEDATVGFAPNLKVAPSSPSGELNSAQQAALQAAKTGKFAPPNRARLSERTSTSRDKNYEDMEYPSLEYRELAAIRLWAVIDYFFPYKEFIGEDWDGVLHDQRPGNLACRRAATPAPGLAAGRRSPSYPRRNPCRQRRGSRQSHRVRD